jgi:protein O-mannosyl-transferase
MIVAGGGTGVADRVEAPDRDAPARHTRRGWGPALRSRRIAAAAVFLIALIAYLPSLRNGFAYDDVQVIQLDSRAHDVSRALRFFAEPYWENEELGLYRPVTSISYALDWRIGGGHPAWFHLVNGVWNAAACTVAFLLLATFVPLGPAMLGALVFALHPVHVEAVANVVGRAELMAAFFSLAALLVWVRSPRGARAGPRRLGALALLYGLALLSKESAVMLPALLVLSAAAQGVLTPSTAARWLREHAVTLALLAAVTLGFLIARTAVLGGLTPPIVDPVLDVADSAGPRILTALQTWPIILRLMFFPRLLLADYGPPGFSPTSALTLGSAGGALILAALVLGGAAAWVRQSGRLAFTLLFLPVALLPVSNLVMPIGVILAERTLYLPSFALASASAFGAAQVWSRGAARAMILVGAAVVVPLFAWRTLTRIPDWASTESVFAALRRDDPASSRGLIYSARVAVSEQEPERALHLYARALNTWPYRQRQVMEAANYAAYVGDQEFARRVADYGLTRWPDDINLVRLRAAIALDEADTALAWSLVVRGLRLEPADSVLLGMRASLAATPQ